MAKMPDLFTETARLRLTPAGRLKKLRGIAPFLVLQKLLASIPFAPVRIGRLCFLRLEAVPQVPDSQMRGPGTVRWGAREDLDALIELRDKKAEYLRRFDAGDYCVVAAVGERIVGYEWFCDKSTHYESVWGYSVEIPEGLVYAYDAYIDPGYRNTGLWLRFKAHLATLMLGSGKIGVLTFVDYGNWPSLRAHLRFRFRPSKTVFAFRILGLTYSWSGPPSVWH